MGSGEQRGLIMNSVNLTGRTTKDIELKATKSGKDVATFNIAVNDYRDRNGKEVVYFFRIVAFGNWARVCHQYAKKGTLIGVTGKLTSNTYADKNGEKEYITEVIANSIDLLARPKHKDEQNNNLGNVSTDSEGASHDMSLDQSGKSSEGKKTGIEDQKSTDDSNFTSLDDLGLDDDLDVPF